MFGNKALGTLLWVDSLCEYVENCAVIQLVVQLYNLL